MNSRRERHETSASSISPSRFYISGHSSGGHWVGVLLTTDWQKDFGLPPHFIKGAVAGSGLFDLKPVRLSVRSNYIKFTDEMEEKLSAQRHLDKFATPANLVYGTLETPEFQRQSRDFYSALKAAGKPVKLSVMEDYNHFEVMERLGTDKPCLAGLRRSRPATARDDDVICLWLALRRAAQLKLVARRVSAHTRVFDDDFLPYFVRDIPLADRNLTPSQLIQNCNGT